MMGTMTRYFLILVFIGLVACNKKAVDAETYIQFVNNPENGLLKNIEVGDFKIEVQLRPVEYVVIQELGAENLLKEDFETRVKDNNQEYFLLRIGSKDSKSDALSNGITAQNEYLERIGYLIANIDKDIYLIEGDDTLRCAMHHFERSYHLTSYHNILLVFDRSISKGKKGQDQLFVYDDAILGIGKLNIKFESKAINNIPNILL